MGLVVMAMLAQQGAHIVALVPDATDENVVQLILLLRESTSNENIFAETCDVRDDAAITAFAERWHKGTRETGTDRVPSAVLPGLATPQTHRLDVLLFLPSAEAVPVMGATTDEAYKFTVLARFRLVNALLPILLAQPPSRDVRIVSAVSPWYAAGLAQFDRVAQPPKGPIFEPWTRVGAAELHWIYLATELQRRLNLLAEKDTRPRTDLHGIDTDNSPPPLAMRRSHVSSVVVCPGFEVSQLSAFFGGPAPLSTVHRAVLWTLWLGLAPALWLLGKPTSRAADAAPHRPRRCQFGKAVARAPAGKAVPRGPPRAAPCRRHRRRGAVERRRNAQSGTATGSYIVGTRRALAKRGTPRHAGLTSTRRSSGTRLRLWRPHARSGRGMARSRRSSSSHASQVIAASARPCPVASA